jgi:hypothetical protein
MSPQSQADIIEAQSDIIGSLADIIEDLRAILVQEGDDPAILREARIALSDWYIATYPHLYPNQGRPQLRLIEGGIPAYPRRYTADRPCPDCGLLVATEVVVQDPGTIGYRCGRGHKWLAAPRRLERTSP